MSQVYTANVSNYIIHSQVLTNDLHRPPKGGSRKKRRLTGLRPLTCLFFRITSLSSRLLLVDHVVIERPVSLLARWRQRYRAPSSFDLDQRSGSRVDKDDGYDADEEDNTTVDVRRAAVR